MFRLRNLRSPTIRISRILCSNLLNTFNPLQRDCKLQITLLFLFIRQRHSPPAAGSARINGKEREEGKTSKKSEEEERERGTEGETSIPDPGN